MKLYSIEGLEFWDAAEAGVLHLLGTAPTDGGYVVYMVKSVGPQFERLPRNWEFCYEIDMTDI